MSSKLRILVPIKRVIDYAVSTFIPSKHDSGPTGSSVPTVNMAMAACILDSQCFAEVPRELSAPKPTRICTAAARLRRAARHA